MGSGIRTRAPESSGEAALSLPGQGNFITWSRFPCPRTTRPPGKSQVPQAGPERQIHARPPGGKAHAPQITLASPHRRPQNPPLQGRMTCARRPCGPAPAAIRGRQGSGMQPFHHNPSSQSSSSRITCAIRLSPSARAGLYCSFSNGSSWCRMRLRRKRTSALLSSSTAAIPFRCKNARIAAREVRMKGTHNRRTAARVQPLGRNAGQPQRAAATQKPHQHQFGIVVPVVAQAIRLNPPAMAARSRKR
jgi:hypothetical protein